MAVISCNRTDTKGGDDNESIRSLTDVYIVRVSEGDEPSTILDSNNNNVPQVGDPHPTDNLVKVKRRRIKETENRNYYELHILYDNVAPQSSESGGGGGGLSVIDVSGGVWYEEYIIEKDVNDVLVRNSVGDPYMITHRRPHPTVSITTRTNDASNISVFMDKVGAINGGGFKWLNIRGKSKSVLFDNFGFRSLGGTLWEYNFDFKFRNITNPESYGQGDDPDKRNAGWLHFELNAGFREIENGVKVPIFNKDEQGQKNGTPVTDPWPITRDNTALDGPPFEQEKLVWNDFQFYPTMNFGLFNFDFTPLLSRQDQREGLG